MAMDRRRTSGGYLPLRDAIDQLFESSFLTPQFLSGTGGGFPPSDVFITDEDVIVELAVPGANPDDINVSVTGDTVSISGEIKHERHTSSKGQPYFQEIWSGKFQRTFTLPTQVDANQADATFDNGILTLRIPKSEATKPRKIQVKPQQTIQGQSGQNNLQTENVPLQSGQQSS